MPWTVDADTYPMNPRPSGHQVSPDTSRQLNSAKWLALAIAVLGVAASVAMFIRAENSEERRALDTLASTGQEVSRVVADLGGLARNQAQALEGFFESSVDVTKKEFDHFASVVGSAPVSGSMFAAPSATTDPGVFTWPVVFETRADIGYGVGFDLASVPELSDAIDRSLSTEVPVSSGFIELPGDDVAGDLVLVSSIRRPDGEILGVGLVVLQIDEVVGERVALLLQGEATSAIHEVVPGQEPEVISTSERWVDLVSIGDRIVGVELNASPAGNARFGALSDWIALLGILTTSLLAILAYNLMKRRASVQQIEKLERTITEKDRFLATVSHELRTPLTAVVGMLEVLNDNLDHLTPEQYKPLLSDARDGALELERLIEDYLTAARLTAGALNIKQEVVNLDTIFSRTIARLNLAENLGVTVRPLGSCVGDSLRIRQIARNILRNAARYADHQIQVANVGDDSMVVIEIRNDGDPVPDDLIDGLFEPFGGSTPPGGTEPIGLGLSVSRGLARRMGGDIRYSVDGKWTVFSVVLPVSPRVEAITRASREPAQSL